MHRRLSMDRQAKTHVEGGRAITLDLAKQSLSTLLTLTSEGIRDLVRTRPLLAFAGAGALGAALGGLLFPRLGRLAFLAVAGYAATGMLQRQRALDVDQVTTKRPSRKAA